MSYVVVMQFHATSMASMEGTYCIQLLNCYMQVSTQLYINAAGNEVLNYLKGLEHDQASQLSAAGDDSLEAFNTFIQRLMGEQRFCTSSDIAADIYSMVLTRYACMGLRDCLLE